MAALEYPRLLYWADLPVSATHAGAILMHRLLGRWPADKLMVVTPGAVEGCDLPGVRKVEPPPSRWNFFYRTRFSRIWMTITGLRILWRARLTRGNPPKWLRQAIKEFRPEAVLTAGVAGAWIPAAAYAGREKIPLHVIVHDDHHYANFWLDGWQAYGEKLFGRTYRSATTRLCVSKPMERVYRERFGAEGEVLLPLRGPDAFVYGAPRMPQCTGVAGAKVFYAGSLSGEGFRMLDAIAAKLGAKGIKLVLYTPSKAPKGFVPDHLELREPIPSRELVAKLHGEADVLLLFTDFATEKREIVRTLFPSKLVDYAAAAVPILVVAPKDACIVDYLHTRPHAADLVTDNNPEVVASAIERLLAQPEKRKMLAKGAVEVGLQDFDHAKVFGQFREALSGARRVAAATKKTNRLKDQKAKRQQDHWTTGPYAL